MSNPVKISEAASLALHSMGMIARTGGGLASAEVIADALGVSKSHLVKVLQRLSKGGLVTSVRGPGGGYSLTRPPREVSVREVYEMIEGPIDVTSCALQVPTCGWASCTLGDLFCKLGSELRDRLEKMTIADFSKSVGESIGV